MPVSEKYKYTKIPRVELSQHYYSDPVAADNVSDIYMDILFSLSCVRDLDTASVVVGDLETYSNPE